MVTATGLQTDYGYDAYGNSTSVTIRPQNDTGAAIRSDSTYTADGNMLASTTGGDRNTVTYSNDTDRSIVTAVTDAKNAVTSYSYDSMRRQTGVTGADGSSVSSVYADDYLTSLSHSGGDSSTTYNFSYGVAGLSTAVKIGETWTLVSNSYNTGAWTLAQQLYGNGLWWKYDYDAQTDDLLRWYTNLSDTGGIGYAYTYDSRGQISKIEKKSLTLENGAITGETLVTAEYYGYDAMDRLTRIVVTDGTNLISDIAWTYDADQNVTAITTRVNNSGTLRTDTYAYSYDDDHRPTNTAYGSVSESITYDGYSRVTGKTVQNSGNTVLSTTYAYRDIDAQYTTTQVSSLTSSFGGNTVSHSYTYDANGNILSDGSTTYAYDSLNQLVWEYNTAAGKAWNYAYDLGGNILSKTEYDYADGQTSSPVTVSYTYGDAVWRDLLTAYNGEAITYDGIGNPTSYRGWGMTWQGGRQLASMQKDGTTLSFSYNDAGLRTEKTVNGSTRRYIWNSSQLMADVGAADAFYFHYSSGGELIGFTYKTAEAETECILVKNQQGDVERVISADGTILAAYTYDAWGNVLTSEGTLAAANPIRYRGYYFDTETSLYYLQSRYYNPAVGRFVNGDSLLNGKAGTIGFNLFSYCGNNPLKHVDPSGYFFSDILSFLDTVLAEAQNTVSSLTPAYAGCAGVALADGPLPFADILAFAGVMALTVGVLAYSVDHACQSSSKAEEKAATASTPIYIYRYRGTNPGNLVPTRMDEKLNSGLSFGLTPQPNSWQTTIEAVNSTGVLLAVIDGPAHVSVYPLGGTVTDWRQAGSSSVWTVALISVSTKIK